MKAVKDIVVSVKGRFEVFDIASEIEKKNRLNTLFSSYPKYFIKKYNISKTRINNFPVIEIISRILDPLINRNLKFQFLDYFLVDIFEKFVIWNLKNKKDFKYFIGQSAFSLSTFKYLKRNNKNIINILYVASTHIDEKIDVLGKSLEEVISLKYYNKIKKEYDIADKIICQSSHVLESFKNRGFNNVYLNISGVDIKNFYYSGLGLFDQKNFNIIFVGSLNMRKGIDKLINVFNNLMIPNKRLFLIGPLSRDFNLENENTNEIKYLGVKKYHELYKYYSSADLLCLFSKEEGFSMVLGQSLCCGTPIISSNRSGAQHFVKNENYGYVYEKFEQSKLINIIKNYYDNLTKIRVNKEKLSNTFKINHSWEKSIQNFLNLIDKI